MRRFLALSIVVSPVASACTTESPDQALNGVCTRELRVQFTPTDTSIAIGQGFRAHVSLSSCGGAQVLADVVRWKSDDPAVATVDPMSGAVAGRSTGATRIAVAGQRYG